MEPWGHRGNKEEKLQELEWSRAPREHSTLLSTMNGAQREHSKQSSNKNGSTRTHRKSLHLNGSEVGTLYIWHGCLLRVSVGLLKVEVGGVSDSYICSWNIFSPTGVSSTFLILGLCLELLYFLILFLVTIPGKSDLFLKEIERESIWGRVKLWRKRSGGIESCNWNVLKRKKLKI